MKDLPTFLLLLHTQVCYLPLTQLHGIFGDYWLLDRSCKIIKLVYLTELLLLQLFWLHFIPQSWIYVLVCFIFSISCFYTLVMAYCPPCREWPNNISFYCFHSPITVTVAWGSGCHICSVNVMCQSYESILDAMSFSQLHKTSNLAIKHKIELFCWD